MSRVQVTAEEGAEREIPPIGEWTADMEEISGYGADYEASCRAMLRAGLFWLLEKPHASSREIEAVLLNSCAGATPNMRRIVANQLGWIHQHGWPAYVTQMRDRREHRLY